MSLVKFCGLFREDDIKYANILKPDFTGFVYAESKRKISVEKSAYLKSMLDKNIVSVGVFLNNDVEEIIEICSKGIIDIIQLHGEYDNKLINTLKEKTGKKITASINVKSVEDILHLQNSLSDYVLLDGAKSGSGVMFDYSLLDEALAKGFNRNYFLAGGLNINNIHKALEYNPYCIDISSGIEANGVKDFNLMKDIMQKIKGESR